MGNDGNFTEGIAVESFDLKERLAAFLVERHPFAAEAVLSELSDLLANGGDQVDALRLAAREKLSATLTLSHPPHTPQTSPGVDASARAKQAIEQVVDDVDGFCAVRYGNTPIQGKGFRSLGQEAIFAAPLRLRRGPEFVSQDGRWTGDYVAPLIRDLGAAFAMDSSAETIRMVLHAQMGKAGPPMDGRDLHIGDFDRGILPASAPLSISTLTVAGLAMAFARNAEDRVAVSFIGEGGSSLGEWHEAINLCAARKLPAIFCVQNNQTALSTRVPQQSATRVFADKAMGYGIPGITVDGTDPEAIAAAFGWAAERARAGSGPTLIETVSMRICGHAHHDDMLYLGREQEPTWDYPALDAQGYANPRAFEFWKLRDPLLTYTRRLERLGLLAPGQIDDLKREAEQAVEIETQAVIDAPWPDPARVGAGVFAEEAPRVHREVLENRDTRSSPPPGLPEIESAPPFSPTGRTFLEAIMLGIGDAMRSDPRVFVYGQDVGGRYGNAFLLLRPLLEEFGDRILNSTLAEGGILGVCVGAALAGQRPIGEIQFNDFVATGFNQLVNNAAKLRYRWGASVPMVVRMPWGGLRKAGPYHSQNTEPWFYRTPGLKIVAPSTPHDARALMLSAIADPDPVLFYEHIALYREPRIKQDLGDAPEGSVPLGRAALRRRGDDLAIVSYGAFVHVAMRVADTLAQDGIESSVLDLRSLAPLDRDSLFSVARHCGKVLIIHEDSRTGGIGESLAAVLQEEAFEDLDAPIRIVGALDTPVPYSPPLEEAFLPSDEQIVHAARLLAAY